MNPQKGHRALRKGRVSIPGHYYFLTIVTDKRRRVFGNFKAATTTAAIINNTSVLKDSTVLAWVIMPDHIHLLIQLGNSMPLGKFVARLKSEVTRKLKLPFTLWAKNFHDHMIRNEADLISTARYLIANPVRAGLVSRVGCYSFWDAIWI